MSGATTELNLRTAVDSDDNADYLTLDLANSLRTVDALFNNVTGHNHGGAHQGGPLTIGGGNIADGSITSPKIADGSIQTVDLADHSVTSVKLQPPIDIAGYFRSTNVAGYPTSGVGLEMYYSPGTGGIMQTFDRTGTVYGPTLVIGSTVSLRAGGTTGLTINADASTTLAGALNMTVGAINLGATVLTTDGNNLFLRSTAAGSVYAQHTDGSLAPFSCGALTAASANLSGAATISGTVTASTATILNTLTAAQLNLSPTQYFLPVNVSIRYCVGASGYHSFEYAAGGAAGISCSTLSATGGGVTASGAVTGASLSATGGHVQFAAAEIAYNGTYLNHSHSIQFNTAGNQIVWPNGSYISGNAGYVQGSQRALKEGVVPVPDSELIAKVADPGMVVSSYNWPEDTRQSIGFMAEDVAAVLPNYVIRDEEGLPVGYNPQELTAILWGAVRDLNARVQTLEAA